MIPGLHGAALHDREGRPVGTVADLLVDPDTLRPAWFVVLLPDGRQVVAPAGGARHGAHGPRLACRATDVATCPEATPSRDVCRHFGVRAAVSGLTPVRAL